MQMIRRLMLVPLVAVSLGITSHASQPETVLADDKELTLRGLVDCGTRVETSCDLKGSFFFWTEGYGPGSQRLEVDITWIKPERVPSIDQEDELCLTGFIRPDQVYQATAINEQCDEGTVNDKDLEQDKKDNRKERNKN